MTREEAIERACELSNEDRTMTPGEIFFDAGVTWQLANSEESTLEFARELAFKQDIIDEQLKKITKLQKDKGICTGCRHLAAQVSDACDDCEATNWDGD